MLVGHRALPSLYRGGTDCHGEESMNAKHSFRCRECGPVNEPDTCRSRGHVVVARKKYVTNNGIGKRCRCARRSWDECPHVWRFAFMWKGTRYRGSLQVTKR